MKDIKLLLGAALLTALCAGPSFAAGVPIDWDPAYGWQLGGGTFDNLPALGEFKMVGTVSQFNPPFQDLNAADPTKEYTFILHGLISQGTVTTASGSLEFYTTQYTGGTFELYEDTSPDASFSPGPPAGPDTTKFMDGTLLLSGNFTSFTIETNNVSIYSVGNIEGSIQWTGGTLVSRNTGPGEIPCDGLFTGGATWNPLTLIPGYIFRHDGKMDLQCPVPVRSSTWGRVKTLYR